MTRNRSLVFVITGASAGIGRALCDFFSERGHEVVGLSRTEPKKPYGFSYVPLDVIDEEKVKTTIDAIVTSHGHIDVLVNCAGIGLSGPLEETSKAQAAKILEVNTLGPFLLCKHALPSLRESKGYVFNLGSVAGPLTIPFQTFYSMSKAALQSFSEGLRLEVKPFGIRVTAVLPGDTKTEFTARREKITHAGLYAERLERSIAKMEYDEQHGRHPNTVAKTINRLIKRKRTPPVVTVGFSYKLLLFLNRILPRRLVLAILYMMYGK